MVETPFAHHDRAALRAIPFETGYPVLAGNPRMTVQANAKTFVTRAFSFVAVHDDLLLIGWPDNLKTLPCVRPSPAMLAGQFTQGRCNPHAIKTMDAHAPSPKFGGQPSIRKNKAIEDQHIRYASSPSSPIASTGHDPWPPCRYSKFVRSHKSLVHRMRGLFSRASISERHISF